MDWLEELLLAAILGKLSWRDAKSALRRFLITRRNKRL